MSKAAFHPNIQEHDMAMLPKSDYFRAIRHKSVGFVSINDRSSLHILWGSNASNQLHILSPGSCSSSGITTGVVYGRLLVIKVSSPTARQMTPLAFPCLQKVCQNQDTISVYIFSGMRAHVTGSTWTASAQNANILFHV